jgi:hypothetical protein
MGRWASIRRERSFVLAFLVALICGLLLMFLMFLLWQDPLDDPSSPPPADAPATAAIESNPTRRIRRKRNPPTKTATDAVPTPDQTDPDGGPGEPDLVVVRDAVSGEPVPYLKMRLHALSGALDEPERTTGTDGGLLLPPDGLRSVRPADDEVWLPTGELIGMARLTGVIWVQSMQTVVVQITADDPNVIPHQVGDLQRTWMRPQEDGIIAAPDALKLRRGLSSTPLQGRHRVTEENGRIELNVPRVPGQYLQPQDPRWCKRRTPIPIAAQPGGEVEMRLHLVEAVVLSGVVWDAQSSKHLPGGMVTAIAIGPDDKPTQRIGTWNHLRGSGGGKFTFGFDPLETRMVVLWVQGHPGHRPLRREFDLSRGSQREIDLYVQPAPGNAPIRVSRAGKALSSQSIKITNLSDVAGISFHVNIDLYGKITARHLEIGNRYLMTFGKVGGEEPVTFEFTYDGRSELELPLLR